MESGAPQLHRERPDPLPACLLVAEGADRSSGTRGSVHGRKVVSQPSPGAARPSLSATGHPKGPGTSEGSGQGRSQSLGCVRLRAHQLRSDPTWGPRFPACRMGIPHSIGSGSRVWVRAMPRGLTAVYPRAWGLRWGSGRREGAGRRGSGRSVLEGSTDVFIAPVRGDKTEPDHSLRGLLAAVGEDGRRQPGREGRVPRERWWRTPRRRRTQNRQGGCIPPSQVPSLGPCPPPRRGRGWLVHGGHGAGDMGPPHAHMHTHTQAGWASFPACPRSGVVCRVKSEKVEVVGFPCWDFGATVLGSGHPSLLRLGLWNFGFPASSVGLGVTGSVVGRGSGVEALGRNLDDFLAVSRAGRTQSSDRGG